MLCRWWCQPLTGIFLISSIVSGSTTSIAQEVGGSADNESTGESTTAASETITNQAEFSYLAPQGLSFQSLTNTINADVLASGPLIDPRGQILGCGGDLLADYTGFSIALYESNPSDLTGSALGSLVPFTRTELPDVPNNGVPAGITPNSENVNPFALSNAAEGRYSFLLDPSRGQLDLGSTYILVVNPPQDSIFNERRIRIEILSNANDSVVSYQATSLDGLPITADGGLQVTDTAAVIPNAEQIALELIALQFVTVLCQANQIRITKTGDRASAAPGDTVIYRLTIRNIADGPLNAVVITDTLPQGFAFIPESVRGEFKGQVAEIGVTQKGRIVTFRTSVTLNSDEVLNIAYAAQLTPDALRGSGENSAMARAQRVDNDLEVRDGPVVHRLRLNPGIVSDCGIIIGRVFVDQNFDGEQQPGEPGVPNAVIFLDDGTRITTDADGLYSLSCVLPGYRTGALDLTSLPGYTLAPNLYFAERNSPSRLVHLAPSSLVRMNFGVTPTFQENQQ
ncbi:MAG: DUF11 domain-containing protein [Cyanothece sp. SIO1E1]|nr:DUF11 domain-containing protein [Cyanothece sp. SIO1E1]